MQFAFVPAPVTLPPVVPPTFAYVKWANNAIPTLFPGGAGTLEKVLGTTSPVSTTGFTLTNNKAEKAGAGTGNYLITASLSIQGTSNDFLGVAVRKNQMNDAEMSYAGLQLNSNITGRGNVTVTGIRTLELGDYVEVWLLSPTSADPVTVVDGQLVIVEISHG